MEELGRRCGRAARLHRPARRFVASERGLPIRRKPGTAGSARAVSDDAPAGLRAADRAERMLDEYAVLGLCPNGHVMEPVRPSLGQDVLTGDGLLGSSDGDTVRVAGRVVRRQRPLAAAVFLTLEDEYGLMPLAVWPAHWERLKGALRYSLMVVEGTVSRRDDTLNVAVQQAWPLSLDLDDRHSRRD